MFNFKDFITECGKRKQIWAWLKNGIKKITTANIEQKEKLTKIDLKNNNRGKLQKNICRYMHNLWSNA